MEANKSANGNNVTTVRNTLPWLLLDALHRGEESRITELIKQPATDTLRGLLQGMVSYWREELSAAEKQLIRAGRSLSGANKAWAQLMLIHHYIDMDDYEAAQKQFSLVNRLVYEDEPELKQLSFLVRLADARFDISTGSYDKAFATLSKIIAEDVDPYFQAIALYLLGSIGRVKPELYPEFQASLQKACTLFEQELNNPYYLALSRLQLALCNCNSETIKQVREVARQLKALGRLREANLAGVEGEELYRQFNPAKDNEDLDRIGECLFISRRMKAIKHKLITNAPGDYPILILGPTGTGKEMIAKAIHTLSGRKGKFVAVNCGAIDKAFIVSELFGYEKGAYTGADRTKKGYVEEAANGTLFLDEIGELIYEAQASLLRFLQDGSFRRLGSNIELHSNARILAATHRNLDEMINNKTFREDLFYRLGSDCRIVIPPLEKRPEEIIPMAMEVIKRHGDGKFRLDDSAKQYLLQRSYPGNVRQLFGSVGKAIRIASEAGSPVITATMLFQTEDEDADNDDSAVGYIPEHAKAMTSFEKGLLQHALLACHWNKSKTCEVLGLQRSKLYRIIRKHDLFIPPEF